MSIKTVKNNLNPSESTVGTGVQGEEVAATYLISKGYGIIMRNYRGDNSEIDIIARDGNCIVFCEVKTAKTNKFGQPVSWVTEEKIKRIAEAALKFIQKNDYSGFSFRFDVIGLFVKDTIIDINHIKNAFSAPEGY
jgi:putative endonuclease